LLFTRVFFLILFEQPQRRHFHKQWQNEVLRFEPALERKTSSRTNPAKSNDADQIEPLTNENENENEKEKKNHKQKTTKNK
jgi:hypothetical protein